MNDWLDVISLGVTLDDMLSIIDDALCHGFEFKVENHTLWFKEVDV